jgi:hypothetical protein
MYVPTKLGVPAVRGEEGGMDGGIDGWMTGSKRDKMRCRMFVRGLPWLEGRKEAFNPCSTTRTY